MTDDATASAGRLLVVTAVPAERDAVRAGLHARAPVEVVAVGVGPAAAAAGTARLLALAQAAGTGYRAVVCAGIGGGFPGRVPVGGLALATRCVAADLGADSPGGFLGLDELGFGTATLLPDPALTAALATALPDAVAGDVLTVSTVTGTAERTALLAARHPDAVAEAMEGYGVACAAAGADLPFAELRAVSNLVGPRDRATWRVGAALEALGAAGPAVGTLAW